MKKSKYFLPFVKIYKNTLLILSAVLLTMGSIQNTFAQDNKGGDVRSLFTQANLMMNENLTDSALKTFLILYRLDTNNSNVCYYIGQLYLKTDAHKLEALPYLEKAAAHVVAKYRPDDPYEKDAPPIAYYYLARVQHLNYQFNDAILNFNKFQKMLHKNDDRQKDIDYWVNCCNNAKMLMESPVDCKIVNLGDSINSPYPDYSPVISADESEILFTSRRPTRFDSTRDVNNSYYEDIWISYAKPNDGGWAAAQNAGPTINTAGNEATVSLSPDGQQLILYRDNSQGDGNLYVSYLDGVQWSYPDNIDSAAPGVVNSPSWEPSACLSPDKKTLFFVSNRPGGLGGTDIYKINIGADGKWSSPVNLGPDVNTEYDEDAPFIHPDDSTMFFSSKGHNTMGGYDVFIAREDSAGNWSHVQNMGYPINTPDDDIYFSVSADGRRAYYTSVRKGGYGEKDNYEVFFHKPLPVQQIAILVGFIKTPDGGPMPNDITVTSSETKGRYSTTARVNPKTGKFLQILRPNQEYNVAINTQGKKIFNQNFFLPADSSYQSLSRAFFRTKIILGDTTNVFVPRKQLVTPVVTQTLANATMSGRLLVPKDTLSSLPNMPIQLLDEKGNVIQTTLTDNNGYFTFDKLNLDNDYILKVNAQDTKLGRLKKLYLANANGKVVRNYDEHKKRYYMYHKLPADLNKLASIEVPAGKKEVASAGTKKKHQKTTARVKKNIVFPPAVDSGSANFTRYFGYNQKNVSENDDGFANLIDEIAANAAKGPVTLDIEASASHVPTKLFSSSNKALAHRRAKAAKDAIAEALSKKKVDSSRIKFVIHAKVQGPAYDHDARDLSKYRTYQYVKVYIR